MSKNRLFYGDNLEVMRRYIKDESVDLVYLDPPFNSNQEYNVLFAEQDGTQAAAQIRAFDDTWRWDQAAAHAYQEVVESGGRVADAIRAFRTLLGDSDMLAYLAMMAPRLVELRRVLKPTGSIYLHCDPTASHYLKVLMDAVFGPKNCRREVIWRSGWVSGFKTKTRNWIRNHDVLLYYVRDIQSGWTFNKDLAYTPHAKGYERRGGGGNPKGVAIDDVWDEVPLYSPWIKSFSVEKLGYMTQKPVELLKRIISVCSRPEDTVLDPFCGCGTTIAAAHELGRVWIGIDITHIAVGLIKHRLLSAYGLTEHKDYKVTGEPEDLASAQALARDEPYQFQAWALGKVGARSANDVKKGPDQGIDGKLYFHDEGPSGKTKQIILSVKGGKTGPDHVRDLRGVVDREGAEIGVLLCLQEPTKAMRAEAASAGFYVSEFWGKYPKIQIISVRELLDDKGIAYPVHREDKTFKKAPERPTGIAALTLDLVENDDETTELND